MFLHRRKNNLSAFWRHESGHWSERWFLWFGILLIFILAVVLASFFALKFFDRQTRRFLAENQFVSKAAVDFQPVGTFWFMALAGLADDFYDWLGFNDERRYLLLFQNNLEMRPTGGFIGSYGLVTIEGGQIKNLFIDDIYNLDKQSEGKLKIAAPAAMKKYNQQEWWFMRDANWSPDWPTAAEKILWFFEVESRNAGLPIGRIDGVVAITPDVVADLLSLTGPTETDRLTFQAADFAVDLERFVEFDYRLNGVDFDERKDIIGRLAEALLKKAESWPLATKLNALSVIKKNLDAKQILLYAVDKKTRQKISAYGWSGEIKQTADDYLMVIDANLAALKTDLVMEKSLGYGLRLENNKRLIGRLEATYRHRGDQLSGLVGRYRNYVRVYRPLGAVLVLAAIKNGDQIINLDLKRDVEIGVEHDKSFAGIFLTVEPRETVTLVLEYLLPENITARYLDGRYRLLAQKQPGTIGHQLKIHLNLNKPIVAYQAALPPAGVSARAVWWQTDLAADREFWLKF